MRLPCYLLPNYSFASTSAFLAAFLALRALRFLWISANTRINAAAPPAQTAISGTLLSGRRKAARPVVPAGAVNFR